LRGELIELRPLRQDDFDALFAVASDPLIWEQHPERTRFQEPVFRVFFADAMKTNSAFVALDRATGQIIGSSRYHGFDAERSVVEIGWTFLAREYWGGRYNGEMKRLMLEHAFTQVARVIFIIGPDNLRSRKAVEKIGGVYFGATKDAKGEDRVVYELTPSLYKRRPSALPAAIRAGRRDDSAAILALYVTVARISGGLARMPDEMNLEYVEDCVAKSLKNGVLLVAEGGGRLLGELHAYGAGLKKFEHVLANLTVAVHPDAQGQGLGRRLFETMLTEVREKRPDILRIELFTQESNVRGQRLYESVGFRRQGWSEQAILGPDGELEADIPMAWLRTPR
jgi:RimJ/RimL family protein N-acetyltransferase